MKKEIKIGIRQKYNSTINFDSLDEINAEYQETQRKEYKADCQTETSSENFSDNFSDKFKSISLFDDNILQQIDMILDYLSLVEEKDERIW